MKHTYIIAAMLALSACGVGDMQNEFSLEQQCRQLQTYGDRYGTPTNKGPCWGRTFSQSVMGNIASYGVEIRGTEHGVAFLTYENGVLISATSGM